MPEHRFKRGTRVRVVTGAPGDVAVSGVVIARLRDPVSPALSYGISLDGGTPMEALECYVSEEPAIDRLGKVADAD